MIPPAQRIRVIEGSMRCFVAGLFALIPLLGLPAALRAIYLYGRTCSQAGEAWNPARTYADLGCVFGWLGFGVGIVLFAWAALAVFFS